MVVVVAAAAAGAGAASEGSSGVRSGRVCLKVAASLSSLGLWSSCRSARNETRKGGKVERKKGGEKGQLFEKCLIIDMKRRSVRKRSLREHTAHRIQLWLCLKPKIDVII